MSCEQLLRDVTMLGSLRYTVPLHCTVPLERLVTISVYDPGAHSSTGTPSDYTRLGCMATLYSKSEECLRARAVVLTAFESAHNI